MAKVYVVIDWENSDILGVYMKKSSAQKSLHDDENDYYRKIGVYK